MELFGIVPSSVRFGKFSRRYSFKRSCLFFSPSSLLHICDTFWPCPTYLLWSVQWFSFFFIFFLPELQFQIHISENLSVCYWAYLSFSNCAFSSCCFTFKTSSKFLIADIMFFNYRMSVLLLLSCRCQNCWNSSYFHPYVYSFLFLHKLIILSHQVWRKLKNDLYKINYIHLKCTSGELWRLCTAAPPPKIPCTVHSLLCLLVPGKHRHTFCHFRIVCILQYVIMHCVLFLSGFFHLVW